jgi:hypothetical protein
MSCPLCTSGNQTEFFAEMILHSRGLKNLDKPGVWLFPKVSVCLQCGLSRFTTPETELALLATNNLPAESSAENGSRCESRLS